MSMTIQKKLLRSSMRILAIAFLILLALVAVFHVISSQRHLDAITNQIQSALEAKGRILVQNNSLALSGMVADNAFLSVQELVSRTVADDPDVVYGIFMDASKKTWINSSEISNNPDQSSPQVLNDSVSNWVITLQSAAFKVIHAEPVSWIEFCSPVLVDGEIAGYIRYGISTRSMVEAASSARAANFQSLLGTLVGLGVIALLAIWLSFVAIRRQSVRLSSPIIQLDAEARIIAQGNYEKPIHIQSDDEIGELAASFEEMRLQVKRYTEHLEEIIAEKMQQVRDILDHIDQGLLTINFDNTINEEFSQASKRMLGRDDLAHFDFTLALGMNLEHQAIWSDWLGLVKSRHHNMRWEKLLRLAPIKEISFVTPEGHSTILNVGFQKIFDSKGDLTRLMVLLQDVTEARRIDRIVREEQAKHENEVKTILSLVNNAPEVIQDFFRDLDERIKTIETLIQTIRPASPSTTHIQVDSSTIASLFRDLHTIKGNASSYGFEQLGHLAHIAEEALEDLRESQPTHIAEVLGNLTQFMMEIRKERQLIDNTAQMLRGAKDGMMVSLAERKVSHIQRIARALLRETLPADHSLYTPLLEACNAMRRVPVGKLADKYSNVVERLSEKVGKKIVFHCSPYDLEVEPTFFLHVNEALIHLLRNAADHGIEDPHTREALGKAPEGHIGLVVKASDDSIILEIHDDGAGIDPEQIAQRALEQNIITASQLASMNTKQKLDLIYSPNLTTRDTVSDISGRGVGMDVVRHGIEAIGGRISLESTLGKGTIVRMEVPAGTTNA